MVGKWDWACFNHLFETELTAEESRDFFERTLPAMAQLALELQTVCPAPIPLLRQGWSGAVTLSQLQIACLLCHSFFCTFPGRRSKRARDKLPRLNFDELLVVPTRHDLTFCFIPSQVWVAAKWCDLVVVGWCW
jgi:hypothetical protein